jgi:hypothetical protein
MPFWVAADGSISRACSSDVRRALRRGRLAAVDGVPGVYATVEAEGGLTSATAATVAALQAQAAVIRAAWAAEDRERRRQARAWAEPGRLRGRGRAKPPRIVAHGRGRALVGCAPERVAGFRRQAIRLAESAVDETAAWEAARKGT